MSLAMRLGRRSSAYEAVLPTTYPRASTREHAVVGVTGVPRPIYDLRFPCERNVDTRGVEEVGKGNARL